MPRTQRLSRFLLAALTGVWFAVATVPSAHAQCTDTHCIDCPADPTCAGCSVGFRLAAGSCLDINECATANGGCSITPLVQCTNTVGYRDCGACPGGYTGPGTTCSDINECATNNGGCSATPPVTCTNTPGARTCGSCPSGYTGPGTTCTDINECATNNGGCAVQAQCDNAPGSRACTCHSGYVGDGSSCNDINECTVNNGGCDPLTTCGNLPGSRNCGTCPSGYDGTGDTTCADINECATDNGGCAPEGQCTNTPGSRGCVCTSGYTGDGLSCTDVNECAINAGGCDPLTACTNTAGSRACGACPSGYSGTGATSCLDINECQTGTPCNSGTCTNGAGDFTCACPGGVTGPACDINGYVPPDKPTAVCENAVANNLAKYVKCVTKCRVQKASKKVSGKDYDEQECQGGVKSCRTAYDKKMLKLVANGTCPACLDQAAQEGLVNDTLAAVIESKGAAYCAGTEPLAP